MFAIRSRFISTTSVSLNYSISFFCCCRYLLFLCFCLMKGCRRRRWGWEIFSVKFTSNMNDESFINLVLNSKHKRFRSAFWNAVYVIHNSFWNLYSTYKKVFFLLFLCSNRGFHAPRIGFLFKFVSAEQHRS